MDHSRIEGQKQFDAAALTNNQRTATGDEREIDLIELFFALLHNWKAMALALIIGVVLMASFHTFFVKPSYRASAQLYITSTDSVISLQDLQIGSALTADYSSIISSRGVLNKVINNLGLNTNYKALGKLVSVSNPTGTHIIQLSVTTSDAELSRNIANELLNVSIDSIYQIVGTSEPTVIDYSEAEAVENVTPGLVRYMAIGGFVGLFLVAIFVIMKVLLDNTIKDDDDVMKYLQLPVLSAVPFYKD